MKHIFSDEIFPMLRCAHQVICKEHIMVKCGLKYQTYDYRLFFCAKGKITISAEGINYALFPGAVIYFPAGTKYQHLPETNENAVLLVCNFDLMYASNGPEHPIVSDVPENFSIEKQIEHIKVDDIDILNNVFYAENFERYHSIFEFIVDAYKNKEMYFRKKCSSLLSYVLMELVSNQTASNKATEIIDYIKNNYSKKITNVSISQLFNYHPNHLNRIIKKYTGVTLHQYLQNYRVNRAIDFLAFSNLTTEQISEQVGFDNPQHFCTVFKRITGKQPSSYRPKC